MVGMVPKPEKAQSLHLQGVNTKFTGRGYFAKPSPPAEDPTREGSKCFSHTRGEIGVGRMVARDVGGVGIYIQFRGVMVQMKKPQVTLHC